MTYVVQIRDTGETNLSTRVFYQTEKLQKGLSFDLFQCESIDSQGRLITSVQTVLTCSKLVTSQAMNQVIIKGSINILIFHYFRRFSQIVNEKNSVFLLKTML
jgi:hypothetical protein